eukprot:TRINITY_DN11231_c0_g1_i3.p1 TRINITY_DN11231_c0_g1~~TRINITY_DN11231_c0_g1_i3.p1  ORF type:complete len:531 (+),score=71.04 TRINITY_DN11231_c0_g1_i3:145-1593(+)
MAVDFHQQLAADAMVVIEALWHSLSGIQQQSQVVASCLPIIVRYLPDQVARALLVSLAQGEWPDAMSTALHEHEDDAIRIMSASFVHLVDNVSVMDGYSDDMSPTEAVQLAVGCPKQHLSLVALMLVMQDHRHRWGLNLETALDARETIICGQDLLTTDTPVLVLASILKAKGGLAAFIRRVLSSASADRLALNNKNLAPLLDDTLVSGFLLKTAVGEGGMEGMNELLANQSDLPWLRQFAKIANARGVQFFKRQLTSSSLDLFSLFSKGKRAYEHVLGAALDACETGRTHALKSAWEKQLGSDATSPYAVRVVVGVMVRILERSFKQEKIEPVATFFRNTLANVSGIAKHLVEWATGGLELVGKTVKDRHADDQHHREQMVTQLAALTFLAAEAHPESWIAQQALGTAFYRACLAMTFQPSIQLHPLSAGTAARMAICIAWMRAQCQWKWPSAQTAAHLLEGGIMSPSGAQLVCQMKRSKE